MNAIAKQDDPTVKFRSQLTALVPQFRDALPGHIKPEKFQRVVATVVGQNPDLLLADRRTLFASCMKCASDGLVPDGREAALVIFNTKVKDQWVKAVQYMPMMAGVLKRIRNSDEIASVQAHVIYENDHFLIRRGLVDSLEHTPLFPGDRGQAIGAYAVAKFKDGSDPQFEVMDRNQIEKVRQVSRSKDRGPWVDHWDEMARKTVFRRLSKWLPMDAETDSVVRRDDDLGVIDKGGAVIDAVVGQDTPGVSKLDALAGPGEDTSETITADGEVIEGDGRPEPPTEEPDPRDAALAQLYRDLAACKPGETDKLERQDTTRALVRTMDDTEKQAWLVALAARRGGAKVPA